VVETIYKNTTITCAIELVLRVECLAFRLLPSLYDTRASQKEQVLSRAGSEPGLCEGVRRSSACQHSPPPLCAFCRRCEAESTQAPSSRPRALRVPPTSQMAPPTSAYTPSPLCHPLVELLSPHCMTKLKQPSVCRTEAVL